MIRVSCSVKTHAFQLAEQLERKQLLNKLYTIYHSANDPFTARFNKRKDSELIKLDHIQTFPFLAPLKRIMKNAYINNSFFDLLVSRSLKADTNYAAFIGWSGMSLKSIRQAKSDGKKTIIERGSSHIQFQAAMLKDEYARWGFQFSENKNIINQELREYELADYIVVPSGFVEKTFIDKGFSREKIFRNNFGSNLLFKPTQPKRAKFTILYVGNLSIRKGLPYFFQAINALEIDPSLFDVWFIGSVSPEINQLIPTFKKDNWRFFGHVNHHDLADFISQCSVAVHPSLEEGLSMVIPQLMACGTPVIATTNTGGEDIISDGKNGYIIPIRSPLRMADKLNVLYSNPEILKKIQDNALLYSMELGSWDSYGDRYSTFIGSIIS